jgi:archaellum component FlaF (FlaF/FlaG flagellin family)
MIINIVLFFFCFVFLICTVVYSARTESYLGEVDCASAKFASDLLEGENTDIFFIGFNPLIEIL